MSLALDVSRVEQVLLMDGWHRVANASFELDAYEFIHAGRTALLDKGGLTRVYPSIPLGPHYWYSSSHVLSKGRGLEARRSSRSRVRAGMRATWIGCCSSPASSWSLLAPGLRRLTVSGGNVRK